MSGSNSYFPPQSSQPPPSQQFTSPPPTYTAYASPPAPAQQQWGQPQVYSPLTAPATPAYNPSAFANPHQQQQGRPQDGQGYPQTGAQQPPMGYKASAYSQPPVNAPPTPAYTPSPYGPSDANSGSCSAPAPQCYPQSSNQPPVETSTQPAYERPQFNVLPTPAYTPAPYSPDSNGPPIQYPQVPPQNQSNGQQPPGNNFQPAYAQPPFNAPPTPAYTPSTSGYPGSNQGDNSASVTQTFSSPQNQSNAQQPPVYNQPPANAPPTTAYTPAPYGQPGLQPGNPGAPATQYFPPLPPNQPVQQPIQDGSQSAYYQPPVAGLPTPAYGPSYTAPGQPPQNGYVSEKQEYQPIQTQPPPPNAYTQTQQTVSIPPAYVPLTEYAQSTPLFTQPPIPPPYSIQGQPPQSAHPQEKLQYQQGPSQFFQQPQNPQIGQQQGFAIPLVSPTQQVNQPFPTFPGPLQPGLPSGPAKDDLKSSKTKRFFGDTLVGRAARSSVTTVTSTMKLPATLSPFGDNNPVTLPNVRYRDAALFATFHVIGGPLVDGIGNVVTDTLGADSFISEIVSSGTGFITGNTIVKYGVFQVVEQAIDKGVLEKVLPEVEKTLRTTSVKSMQVAIKHKLMGVDADLRFVGTYPTTSAMACDKGWFCPYLYTSGRTPIVPRAQDFAIAQFFAPYVAADTALTHKLLCESASVIPLCDPDPTARLSYSRLLVLFTGITPFRANMWSTSRRPGCAQLFFHLLDGCPALVLPVCTAKTPVLAWSPWTLTQMQNQVSSGYQPATQHQQITSWLLELVERQGLYPCVRDMTGAFERVMGMVVTMIINGALAAPKGVDGKVFGKVDIERAGIIMFRY